MDTHSHKKAVDTDLLNKLVAPLYQSYVSAIAGYIDHSLKHREDSSKHAEGISNYTHKLMTGSLKCLDDEAKKEKRAEIIDYYARNQINLADKIRPFKSAETLRKEVKEAEQVVRWGLEQIEEPYEKEREKRKNAHDFLLRVSSSEIIDLYERLLATQQRLAEKLRVLSANE